MGLIPKTLPSQHVIPDFSHRTADVQRCLNRRWSETGIGEVHRRYTRMVNFREGWRGHLWQGRFASFVLDEPYLLTAARYVELNPVRAGLIGAPSRYRWSSARAHVRGKDDTLVRVAPLVELAPNWRAFLARVIREEDIKLLRAHENTGRPWETRHFWRRSNKI